MNKGVDLGAVRQVLDGLRQRIDVLEAENRSLREENETLSNLLRGRERGLGAQGTTPLFTDSSDAEDERELSLELSRLSRRAPPVRGEPRPPARKPVVTDPGLPLAGEFSRAETSPSIYGSHPGLKAPESAYYGRGLIPQVEFEEGAAVPPPSGPAPGFDLGFINQVPVEELETLPYGLMVLDTDGNVLFYNETESRLAGFSRERVLGKSFFGEVAPCTRVQAFEGRFKEFVEGKLGRVTFFDFAFHFARGTQNVLIGLSHGRKKGHINVMMMRR